MLPIAINLNYLLGSSIFQESDSINSVFGLTFQAFNFKNKSFKKEKKLKGWRPLNIAFEILSNCILNNF